MEEQETRLVCGGWWEFQIKVGKRETDGARSVQEPYTFSALEARGHTKHPVIDLVICSRVEANNESACSTEVEHLFQD